MHTIHIHIVHHRSMRHCLRCRTDLHGGHRFAATPRWMHSPRCCTRRSNQFSGSANPAPSHKRARGPGFLPGLPLVGPQFRGGPALALYLSVKDMKSPGKQFNVEEICTLYIPIPYLLPVRNTMTVAWIWIASHGPHGLGSACGRVIPVSSFAF